MRDYADNVDPQTEPDWPGYPVSLEPRPNITGTPPAAAKRLIDGWLLRRRVQSASAARVNRLLPGPCGGSVGQPTPARPAGVPYPVVTPYPVGPLGKPYAAGPYGKAHAAPVGKAQLGVPSGGAYGGGAYAGGGKPGAVPVAPAPPQRPAAPSAAAATKTTATGSPQ